MFVNIFETPTGPHYSRPHSTRESAEAGGRWLDEYSRTQAKALPPHRHVQIVRVILKDPALAEHMSGGPTMCGPAVTARTRRQYKRAAGLIPTVEIPAGYANATEMCRQSGRPWSRYWDTRVAKAHAAALADELQLPVSAVVVSVWGGATRGGVTIKQQGTWVHPVIATRLRAWLGQPALKEAA